MKSDFRIALGEKVIDSVTNFAGVVTGRCDYLYGSSQIKVEAMGPDGKFVSEWFDESRLTRELA
jgi:hypothetical protein